LIITILHSSNFSVFVDSDFKIIIN
jgi:hypothetical protein